MPNENIVLLAGHMTRDPEVIEVGDTLLAKFGLAVSKKWKNKQGEMSEKTCFVDVNIFGAAADFVGKYLHKGSAVLVNGELELDTWEKDGQKRSKHSIRARTVQSLSKRSDGEGRKPEPRQPETYNPASEPDDEPPF